MFEKNKNSCNIYDIKKRYLELIKKGNDLLKQREIEVEKQEKNFIEFNSTYYDLKDVKTKRSVKVEEINSKKGKYVDKKNKKRLIITSVFAYILSVIISSLLTSFKYTPLIPFLGVCGVYVNILFEYDKLEIDWNKFKNIQGFTALFETEPNLRERTNFRNKFPSASSMTTNRRKFFPLFQ